MELTEKEIECLNTMGDGDIMSLSDGTKVRKSNDTNYDACENCYFYNVFDKDKICDNCSDCIFEEVETERAFDFSRIIVIPKGIVNPKQLEIRKEYYVSYSIQKLKGYWEKDIGFEVYNGHMSPCGFFGMVDNISYYYFYPREQIKEPKYKPYDFDEMGFDGLKKWIGKTVIASNLEFLIYGVVFEDCELKLIVKVRGSYEISFVRNIKFFEDFTWKDGTPCGQEVKDE